MVKIHQGSRPVFLLPTTLVSPLRRHLRYPERTHEVTSNSNDDRPLDQIDDFFLSFFSLFLFTQTPTDSLIMGQTRSTENLLRHLKPPFFFHLFFFFLKHCMETLRISDKTRRAGRKFRFRDTDKLLDLGKQAFSLAGYPPWQILYIFISFFFLFRAGLFGKEVIPRWRISRFVFVSPRANSIDR